MKLLEAHGIRLLPEDTGVGGLESSMLRSGVRLTEAGKLALNLPSSTTSPAKRTAAGAAPATKIIRLSRPSEGAATTSTIRVVSSAGGGGSNPPNPEKQPRIIKLSPEQFAALKAGKIAKETTFFEICVR